MDVLYKCEKKLYPLETNTVQTRSIPRQQSYICTHHVTCCIQSLHTPLYYCFLPFSLVTQHPQKKMKEKNITSTPIHWNIYKGMIMYFRQKTRSFILKYVKSYPGYLSFSSHPRKQLILSSWHKYSINKCYVRPNATIKTETCPFPWPFWSFVFYVMCCLCRALPSATRVSLCIIHTDRGCSPRDTQPLAHPHPHTLASTPSPAHHLHPTLTTQHCT